MSAAKLASKGRITIPLDVRQRLGLKSGDRIQFVEIEGGFAIVPMVYDIRSLKGLLRKPARPVSIEDMKTATRVRTATLAV